MKKQLVRVLLYGLILPIAVILTLHASAIGKAAGDPIGYEQELRLKYPNWLR